MAAAFMESVPYSIGLRNPDHTVSWIPKNQPKLSKKPTSIATKILSVAAVAGDRIWIIMAAKLVPAAFLAMMNNKASTARMIRQGTREPKETVSAGGTESGSLILPTL